MDRSFLNPVELYQPGTYSQAVRAGNTLYCAGVVGLDAQARSVGDRRAQIERAYENLVVLLKAGGATPADLVSTRVYLTHASDIALHREIRARYLTDPPTPYTQLVVQALGREDLIIEIECIAVPRGG